MELPGRGTTFVRTVPGPPDAPTLLLLHGWTATADLNWFTCYHPLGRQFRVVALDHRGHGRGIRIAQAVPSGGLRRRRDRCAATCSASSGASPSATRWAARLRSWCGSAIATVSTGWCCAPPSGYFADITRREAQLPRPVGSGRGRAADAGAGASVADRAAVPAAQDVAVGAVGGARSQPARLAHGARGGPSDRFVLVAEWIGEVDVPTSVVITMRDRVVPVRRQVRLFESIRDAEAYRVDGDHDVVVSKPERFVPTLIRACRQRGRARRRGAQCGHRPRPTRCRRPLDQHAAPAAER